MSLTIPRPLRAACAALALAAAAAHTYARQTVPEAGRWITASGNVEVEIAPCGPAYCGTVTRVIANHSMSMPGMPMAVAGAASPLGRKIVSDLMPAADGGWQGRIYNRENGKTYGVLLAADGADQLHVTIYEDDPATGRVQVWRRPAPSVAP